MKTIRNGEVIYTDKFSRTMDEILSDLKKAQEETREREQKELEFKNNKNILKAYVFKKYGDKKTSFYVSTNHELKGVKFNKQKNNIFSYFFESRLSFNKMINENGDDINWVKSKKELL